MALTVSSFSRRSTRLALVALLAAVLVLQGMAVGVFTTLGPAHFHKKSTESVLVLEDVRRWTPSRVREPSPFALLGHSHGAASAQRHHHASDDGSVVNLDVDSAANGASLDEALSASTLLTSFWAIDSGGVRWGPTSVSTASVARPSWAAISVVVEPLDRPPKAV